MRELAVLDPSGQGQQQETLEIEASEQVPQEKPQYGALGWWEARYRSEPDKKAFDWYLTYTGLKEILMPKLREQDHILVLGCGISRMPAQLHEDGFRNVTSIDNAGTAVALMRQEHKESCPELQWLQMDMRMLDFPSENFEVVLDKAATDALLTGKGSFHNMFDTLKEVWRVLKPGGCYVCISHAAPNKRFHHFQRSDLGWTVEHTAVAKNPLDATYDLPPSECYHIYTCTKAMPTQIACVLEDFDEGGFD